MLGTIIQNLDNYSESATVVAISVFIASLVSMIISFITKRRLQAHLESIKQHNAISQEIYQSLFQQRIELYKTISEKFEKYDSITKVAYPNWYDEYGSHDSYNSSFYELSDNLKDLVKPNQILISTKLSNSYREVFNKQSPYLKKIYHLSSEGEPYLEEAIAMRKNTEKEVLKLYRIVQTDIEGLRKSLAGKF